MKGPGWEIYSQLNHLSMSKKCSGWTQTFLIGSQMVMMSDDVLTDVRAPGITSRSVSAKTPRANARDDACMDLKDLPEYLQPLMEWISEEITTRECEELAAAIYEYRNVFSNGPEDMGQTDLVTLLIPRSTIPYAYHPDDFPSLNSGKS